MTIEAPTLGELACKTRGIDFPSGHEKGRCAICGVTSSSLVFLALRKTFTGAEYINDGGLACPWCNHLYEDQSYRYHNFIVTARRYLQLKPGEVLPALFSVDAAELPFVLYTTETYQKQGYLRLARRGVNYSLDMFTAALDTVLLYMSRATLLKDLRFIAWCMREGIYRQELLAGKPKLKTMREIEGAHGNSRQVLQRIQASWKGLNFKWAVLFMPNDASTIELGDLNDW
jgi:hypothetical protein